jgi:hypothetical protein
MSSAPARWIDESLSHLESLEAERADRETALETTDDVNKLRVLAEEVERLDGEIRGLYATLEAVADDEENESANTTTGYPQLEDYDPFGPPPSQTGMYSADVIGADETLEEDSWDGAGDTSLGSTFDALGDPAPRFSGETLKWVGIAAGALALLVTAVVVLASGGSDETTATGPTRVIKAGPIPEDTQGPRAAVGADVNRTRGRVIKRSKRRRQRRVWRQDPEPVSGPSAADREGKIEIKRTTDPIAGVR